MTRTGTSYFVSEKAAIRYYRPYGYRNAAETVRRKLAEGEIHIGKPQLKAGERLVIVDNGTRYAIEQFDPPSMTLYDAIKAAGIAIAAHESDLYFPVTEQSTAILKQYPLKHSNATKFTNQVEGGIWYDVPFAYDPYWDALRRVRANPNNQHSTKEN